MCLWFTAKVSAVQVELLQQRLTSTEQQLQHTERQLAVLLSHPIPGSPKASSSLGVEQLALGPVVEQLKKLLEVKEDRIRCLKLLRIGKKGRIFPLSSTDVKRHAVM